ncbi:3-hydroxyacyl-CoA dehydrogenase family protein [bacterium]|nr:3-hydroxyacyl-CoA dehydrogenase family protein [bacterium]
MRKLGIVGFGTMGSEIALLGALAGLEVAVASRDPEAVPAGKQRLAKLLRLASRDEKFFAAAAVADDSAREATLARISAAGYSDFGDCDYVIESAPEDLRLKTFIFEQLAAHCRQDCILATNTSSISITQLAEATAGPQRVVGMHFFNPPMQMALVEVIPGEQTSPETVQAALDFSARLGKKGIKVAETPGFVVNRVLMAMMNEAMRLLEEDAASMQDIDDAMRLGAGFPLGPFKLADLVGLDVYLHTCESIYRQSGRESFKPSPLLVKLVEEGKLGRKSKEGFYKY